VEYIYNKATRFNKPRVKDSAKALILRYLLACECVVSDKEIAGVRKAKAQKSKEGSTTPAKEKKAKDTLKDILAYFTALDVAGLTEDQQDQIAEIHAVLESKMMNA
jgi:hypothetical protein